MEAELLGSGRPGRRAVWHGRGVISIYFWGKWHWVFIKWRFKKASLINVHSFITEVKLKRRWRSRRRGWCPTPPAPRKPHGKNILKCRSIKDSPLRSSECIGFHNVSKRQSPRRSSECITFVMLYQKDGPKSECILNFLRDLVLKRQSLKEFRIFLC